jgi:hypothetical protein
MVSSSTISSLPRPPPPFASAGPFGIVLAVTLALRLAYVLAIPDYDGDAYAHYEMASKTRADPWDLHVHWIWLPGYHYLVATLQRLGATFRDVRLLNAILATAAPVLLARWTFARAAMLCALSSLVNLLGTSALAETTFVLAVLGACVLIDEARAAERPWRAAIGAGIFLTIACSMRYEAWFGAGVLGLACLVETVRRRTLDVRRAVAAGIPLLAIGAYVVVRRRVVDHEWLWFVHETYRFTHMQRGLSTASPLFDVLWFPVLLPGLVLGPAFALVPVGAVAFWRSGSAWNRPSLPLPVGIAAFLALTYLGRGALGQSRYLTVLMPFACVLVARGAEALAARWRGPSARVHAVVAVSVAITALLYVGNVAKGARERGADLRAREERADGSAR